MSGYRTPNIGALDHVTTQRARMQEDIHELQRPTGTSVEELAERVTKNLATVDSRIDAGIVARSYSKGDVDFKVSNPPSVTTSGTGRFDGGIFSLDARNFIVVQNYAAQWIDQFGHQGISPSSRRFKRDIETWHPDVALLFEHLRAVRFHYDVPDQPYGYDGGGEALHGPHPDPGLGPWQYGFIAEELVEAGLEMFTFRDADGLVLGINYDRVVVALFDVLQRQQVQIDDHEVRLVALEGGTHD